MQLLLQRRAPRPSLQGAKSDEAIHGHGLGLLRFARNDDNY
jgi:hypothetical protein